MVFMAAIFTVLVIGNRLGLGDPRHGFEAYIGADDHTPPAA